MKKNTSSSIIFLSLLALFGCAAKKHIPRQPDVATIVKDTTVTTHVDGTMKITKPTILPEDLKAIQARQIDFVTFSAKAKAKLNIDGATNDVTLNIRIEKGKRIWVSVTALLGLEGARAVITPDSIKIINRLDATYLKKPFNFLYQYAGNQVNYAALEALLLGNAWPGFINDTAVPAPGVNASELTLSGNSGDLFYKLFFDPNRRLEKTLISGSGAVPRKLQVSDNGAMPVADRVIPAQISISTSATNSAVNIDMTYTKAEFNTRVEFPFAVPARYSVVN